MMTGRRAACAVIVAVLAAGCGSTGRVVATPRSSATTARTTATTTTTVRTQSKVGPPPPPSPKGAAVALANHCADGAMLPPGSVRTNTPLPRELRGPWEVPAGVNLVGVRRVWSVAMDPDAVVAFLKTHAPAGLVEGGVGTFTSRTTRVMDVAYTLTKLPPNIALAGLEIGVEAHGAGSLVDVIGGAQWTAVRRADEHVGGRDRVVVVSELPWSHDAPVGRRVVVTGPKRSAIVLAFNTQKISPTGDAAGGCFALGVNTVSYRVAFAASATASPDVVATIAPCTPVKVTVGGRRNVSLAWGSGDLDPAVAHALGEKYLSFASSAPG
jgi:hypothetical protein